jgi:carbamoyl-phosphate synthase large subunit
VLVDLLDEKGAEIRCFDIKPKPATISKSVDYQMGDISDITPEKFTEFDPEVVFHLAAVFERSEESREFWSSNFDNNTKLSHNVIAASKQCKRMKRFVFASSYLVYAPGIYLFKTPKKKPFMIKETDPIGVRNICGASKYYTEKELEFFRNFKEYRFTSASARIYRVYGRGSKDIISRFVRSALAGKKIEIYGEENSFDFIFADDVVKGLLRIAEISSSGPINLATGVSTKIATVLDIIKSELPKIQIRRTDRKMLYEASTADITLLKTLTGWQPETRLEDGIKNIIDFEKNR